MNRKPTDEAIDACYLVVDNLHRIIRKAQEDLLDNDIQDPSAGKTARYQVIGRNMAFDLREEANKLSVAATRLNAAS